MATDPSPLSTDQLLAQAGWLHALARKLVGDSGAADDVVQDTFISALRRPPHADRPLRPWLAKVARNLVRARVRSERSRRARETVHDGRHETPSAAELSEKLESQRLLVEAIGELAEPYRATILLHYWEHLSSEEIARRQGMPAGTVRWRLKQGVDALRERLDARCAGDRRAWALLLAPLARTDAPAATATSASLVTGVLSMNVFLKASAGIAVALAVTAGWWVTRLAPREVETVAVAVPDERVSVVFKPLEDTAGQVTLLESHDAGREALAVSATSSEAAAAASGTRVEARIVDEHGRPIPGAALRAAYLDTTVDGTSDARGDVALDLDLPDVPTFVHVRACAVGRASCFRDERLSGANTVYLGDLVLVPGGAVSGRVADRGGRPIANARVSLDDLDLPQAELERRFRYFIDAYREPAVLTQDDGTFLLEGVPAGFVRLLASDREHLPSFSGVIEVRQGHESQGVLLALHSIPGDRLLRGVVLDPSGSAIPGARVQYRATQASGRGGSGTFLCDARGRFQTICKPSDSFELFTEDPEQRWSAVWRVDVRGGQDEIVLRFTVTREFELRVTGTADQPLEEYRVHVWSSDRARELGSSRPGDHPDGRSKVRIPSSEFIVEVEALAHQLGTLGPFAPESVSDRLSIRLEAAPGIRGRVLDHAGPVSGARVRLFEDQHQCTTHNGFPVFVQPLAVAEVQSEPDGTFLLTVRRDGRYHVRAETAGYAASMVGPLDVGWVRGLGGMDIVLTDGGAIEGRVRVGPASSPAGVIVGFSRGDAFAFTLRVGPDGMFKAERLTPGRWMVRRVDKEILEHAGSSSSWTSGRWDEIPSACEVLEGRTTYFDLDLGSGQASATLVGELRVDGAAPGAWNAMLLSAAAGRNPIVLVDVSGQFRVTAPDGGDQRLFLTCLSGRLEGLRLGANVTLRAGETRWSLDLATAELDLHGRASELPPKEHFAYSVSDIPGTFLALRTLPQGEEPATIAVPAGKGEVVRFHDETGPQHGAPSERKLPAFELRPGQRARCERP